MGSYQQIFDDVGDMDSKIKLKEATAKHARQLALEAEVIH